MTRHAYESQMQTLHPCPCKNDCPCDALKAWCDVDNALSGNLIPKADHDAVVRVLGPLLNEHDAFVLAITNGLDAPSRWRHESAHARADEVVRDWRAAIDAAKEADHE